MRIKFDYGKEQVPIGVISCVLSSLNAIQPDCHTSSFDIYMRFTNNEGKAVDIGFEDESGNYFNEYFIIVTKNKITPPPNNTIKHESMNIGNQNFEIYWTIK